MTTGPLLVVQTFVCAPSRDAGAHYEIHLAPALPPHSPRALQPRHLCHRCTVLVTADEALYQDALDAEGSPEPFIAHYHRDGVRLELDALLPAAVAPAGRTA